MKRLIKLLFFRPGDFWLASKTFVLLGLIRLGLWRLSFAKLRQTLTFFSHKTLFITRKQNKSINKIIWAVNVSSRYMPGNAKCLARALTTEVLMNRHGHSPELRIGVAKGETGKLEAHAWIESQGKVLIGQLKDLARFQVLPLPSHKVI